MEQVTYTLEIYSLSAIYLRVKNSDSPELTKTVSTVLDAWIYKE